MHGYLCLDFLSDMPHLEELTISEVFPRDIYLDSTRRPLPMKILKINFQATGGTKRHLDLLRS